MRTSSKHPRAPQALRCTGRIYRKQGRRGGSRWHRTLGSREPGGRAGVGVQSLRAPCCLARGSLAPWGGGDHREREDPMTLRTDPSQAAGRPRAVRGDDTGGRRARGAEFPRQKEGWKAALRCRSRYLTGLAPRRSVWKYRRTFPSHCNGHIPTRVESRKRWFRKKKVTQKSRASLRWECAAD